MKEFFYVIRYFYHDYKKQYCNAVLIKFGIFNERQQYMINNSNEGNKCISNAML
jgi:hypothetical protein